VVGIVVSLGVGLVIGLVVVLVVVLMVVLAVDLGLSNGDGTLTVGKVVGFDSGFPARIKTFHLHAIIRRNFI